MSFSTLIASLKQCKEGPFHFEKDHRNEWKAVPGPPAARQSKEVEELAREMQIMAKAVPLALPDLVILEKAIKNLTLEPGSSGFISLFKENVKTTQPDPLGLLLNAVTCHIESVHLADFESIKRSLEYLAKIDDINRFAAAYRKVYYPEKVSSGIEEKRDPEKIAREAAARENFENDMQAFTTTLSRLHPHRWLKRVEKDPQWPCTLVPIAYLANAPKRLDLQGCEEKTIADVLAAHYYQKYFQLVVSINCEEAIFCRLVENQLLDGVIKLDLQQCQRWDWNRVKLSLVKLKRLQDFSLPMDQVQFSQDSSPREEGKLKVLDLSDSNAKVVIAVLSSFYTYTNLEVIVNFSQDDFVSVCVSDAFNNVRILDLRKCPRLEWQVIEPHLAKLPHLHNVFLPPSLEGLNADLALSDLWREEMDPLIRQQLLSLYAKKNERPSHWFLHSPHRKPYFELIAHSVLLGMPPDSPAIQLGSIGIHFLFHAPERVKEMKLQHSWNFAGIDRVTLDLVLSLPFEPSPLSLDFGYSSSITQSGLSRLFKKKEIKSLSLFGCGYVDDSFLADAPIHAPCHLDLRGTNVSAKMVKKLRRANIAVLYDPDYQTTRQAWEKHCQSYQVPDLTLPAFKALMYFRYTGYMPILSIPLAMVLFKWIKKPELQKLKDHCLNYMVINVTQEVAFDLYQFAKETSEPTLLFVTRYFIEIFCNPYSPQSPTANNRFEAILRDPPPKPCELLHIKIATEKQVPQLS